MASIYVSCIRCKDTTTVLDHRNAMDGHALMTDEIHQRFFGRSAQLATHPDPARLLLRSRAKRSAPFGWVRHNLYTVMLFVYDLIFVIPLIGYRSYPFVFRPFPHTIV